MIEKEIEEYEYASSVNSYYDGKFRSGSRYTGTYSVTFCLDDYESQVENLSKESGYPVNPAENYHDPARTICSKRTGCFWLIVTGLTGDEAEKFQEIVKKYSKWN